jgi:hypothetical protein
MWGVTPNANRHCWWLHKMIPGHFVQSRLRVEWHNSFSVCAGPGSDANDELRSMGRLQFTRLSLEMTSCSMLRHPWERSKAACWFTPMPRSAGPSEGWARKSEMTSCSMLRNPCRGPGRGPGRIQSGLPVHTNVALGRAARVMLIHSPVDLGHFTAVHLCTIAIFVPLLIWTWCEALMVGWELVGNGCPWLNIWVSKNYTPACKAKVDWKRGL